MFIVFSFPDYSISETDIILRKATRILLEDIESHSSQNSLRGRLRKIGIYKSGLNIIFYQKFGYFYYFVFGDYGQELSIIKVFKETIDIFQNSTFFFKLFRKPEEVCA
jgi:hypothetical protein